MATSRLADEEQTQPRLLRLRPVGADIRDSRAGFGQNCYVDLLSADTRSADGSYDRPYKSWRVALQHVTSGDTIVAKNGDYRKAGAQARWGGLSLTLTLADELQKEDPHPPVTGRPDATCIYRYDPRNLSRSALNRNTA
jgi:hypothetical protein